MQYLFDVEIAKEYGVNEAIMINYFILSMYQNKVNKDFMFKNINLIYTIYNTDEDYKHLFPFWDVKQIKKIIKSLIKQNVIIKQENFYDGVYLYSVTKEYLKKHNINIGY